jgi:RNA polymerase sigma-70 factor (ECF subfamily)
VTSHQGSTKLPLMEVLAMHDQITLGKKISSWFPVIRRKVLSYLRSADDADDVTQEIMLRLLKTKSLPKQPSQAWIHAVVRNAVTDFWRDQQREDKYLDRKVIVDTLGLRHDSECPERIIEPMVCEETIEPDFVPAVADALAIMTKPAKQTLLLHANGYSYEEIAAMTSVNLGTVRSRLHYAKHKARELLAAYR